MKNILYILSTVLFLFSPLIKAEKTIGFKKAKSKNVKKRALRASACTRSKGKTTIEYNNVRALINTGGDMWWDLVGQPKYEIPKNSNKTALFAGAIWVGGTDVNKQLRLAAQRFRSLGVDYWTGPLIMEGTNRASVTEDVCEKYDRHFVMEKQEVSRFRSWFKAKKEGNTAVLESEFSGYSIPQSILDWPAHGDAARGYDFYLAPFYDEDGNGEYNPESGGDYPYFEYDKNAACGTSRELRKPKLYGDYTMWWVYNDNGNIHTETQGQAIGMEIRAQYFAYATDNELNDMTFGNYALINRSTYTLYDTYFGVWTDADMGYALDDYVGCDVERGLGYLYNGKDVDGNGGYNHYGANPPAIGVDFFEGPYMDPWVRGGDTLDRPSPLLLNEDGRPLVGQYVDTLPLNEQPDGMYNGGINGLNFGDGIPGNERWGMRRFLYHQNGNGFDGDPEVASDYYNYLRGLWKDNRPMVYGGTGYEPNGGGIPSYFMFPGNTDPKRWSTVGKEPNYDKPGGWTEENENTAPYDRRFVQSAGPFTLLPGAINDITVGIVWARANDGAAFSSVKKVQAADDKAQRLFETCFVMIDGPDAPELKITEMDKKLIFQIYNIEGVSNNFNKYPEDYFAKDPFIVLPDTLNGNATANLSAEERTKLASYRFEGYQVFQLKDKSVNISSLDDPAYSRLVYQCDVKNDVSTIINYVKDPITGQLTAVQKVQGINEGIDHTFVLTEDAFATGVKTLVNFKKYYYVAVAYAYNNYKTYDPTNSNSFDGQTKPYLRGRKSAKGAIKTFEAMPGFNEIADGGTVLNTKYGDKLAVTMLEGMGNGQSDLQLEEKDLEKIMSGAPWSIDTLHYKAGHSPLDIFVTDPQAVKDEDYILRFDVTEYATHNGIKTTGYINEANWYFYPDKGEAETKDTVYWVLQSDGTTVKQYDTTFVLPMLKPIENVVINTEDITTSAAGDNVISNPELGTLRLYPEGTVFSQRAISENNEQIIPELGIGLKVAQIGVPGPKILANVGKRGPVVSNGLVSSSIDFEKAEKFWLRAVPQTPKLDNLHWRRSGNIQEENNPYNSTCVSGTKNFVDPDNHWNNIANGLFANYRTLGVDAKGGKSKAQVAFTSGDSYQKDVIDNFNQYQRTPSIQLIITKDTTKWTRCPVVEMCEYDWDGDVRHAGPSIGGAEKFHLRRSPSVYRNGTPMPASKVETFTVKDSTFVADYGMGWFPGYAIDIETGERLNIFFGEDSRWVGYNGGDMLWNPSPKLASELYWASGGQVGDLILGGKHNIYVWGHSFGNPDEKLLSGDIVSYSCAYDEGQYLYALLKTIDKVENHSTYKLYKPYLERAVYSNVVYAAHPYLADGFEVFNTENDPYGFIRCDVKVNINMANPYRGKSEDVEGNVFKPDSVALNANMPMFKFSTRGLAPTVNNEEVAETALDNINVVPNPYYAYNEYETGRLDKRVRLINLPNECTITIYNLGGGLIRRFKKSDNLKTLDWNLKNSYGIEIATGVYIIHIDVPGVGEKVLRWYGALRPIDLNNI